VAAEVRRTILSLPSAPNLQDLDRDTQYYISKMAHVRVLHGSVSVMRERCSRIALTLHGGFAECADCRPSPSPKKSNALRPAERIAREPRRRDRRSGTMLRPARSISIPPTPLGREADGARIARRQPDRVMKAAPMPDLAHARDRMVDVQIARRGVRDPYASSA
jgi:hypothetical protein